MYNLMKEERETTIGWSDADSTATIYTYDKRLINRLGKLGVEIHRDENGAVFADIPKTWIKVNPPRQLSEEQKAVLTERMARLREKAA